MLMTHCDLHKYNLHEIDFGAEWNDIFARAWDAMNAGNWDRSDAQVDYFDVGWYAEICLGRWDRPFQCIGTDKAADAA